MPYVPNNSVLNATTQQILNTIRANASPAYRDSVPAINKYQDVVQVGDIITGTPGLRNEFLGALLNRIGLVVLRSARFYNKFRPMYKGYVYFGETVENIFIEIADVRDFNPDKAPQREFAYTPPHVLSAFYIINWEVQYPVSIQNRRLKRAFMSIDGVRELIEYIIDSVYKAAEYDEYLLCKYLLIKGYTRGTIIPINIPGDIQKQAGKYRGYSYDFESMTREYNSQHVLTATPAENKYIIMDNFYAGEFDVEVLAQAFHMEKAEYEAKSLHIDAFNKFDNKRWAELRTLINSVEEVTAEELQKMANVHCFLVDEDFFQIYSNDDYFTETYVGSGAQWNYFYNVTRTVAYSPFANAIAFTTDTVYTPESLTATVVAKTQSATATVLTFSIAPSSGFSLVGDYNFSFIQTEAATELGVAVEPYGVVTFPTGVTTGFILTAQSLQAQYSSAANILPTLNVGATVTLNMVTDDGGDDNDGGDDDDTPNTTVNSTK